jgi:hypothetical protein
MVNKFSEIILIVNDKILIPFIADATLSNHNGKHHILHARTCVITWEYVPKTEKNEQRKRVNKL